MDTIVELSDNVSSHAPVDPGLVLPDAVRQQRDRANALLAAQHAPPPNGQTPPPPNGYTPDGALLHADSLPTNSDAQPFDLTLPPAAPPPPSNGQSQEPPTPPEEWERRFHSINGRYHNELPRLRDAVQQLSERNDQLERLLASDGRAPGGPGTGRGPDAPPLTADFTPQEIEDWGPEMLGMLTRVADSRAAAIAQQLQPVMARTAQAARQQMIEYLDREVPDWPQINVAQEFMDWALLPDEFSGVIRRNLIKQWWEANNAPRVAAFFRSFVSGMPGRPANPSPQPVPPAPPPAPASNRLSLQELAAPSGSGSAAGVPPPPAAKRVYKRSEIAQFYKSRSLGHYRGREVEAQAVETDIFAAQREGRVING